MAKMRLALLLPAILLFIFGTSCIARKEPRTKERVVTMQRELPQAHVELHLGTATIHLPKEAVLRILNSELRRDHPKEVRANKEKLKYFLTRDANRSVIAVTEQLDLLEGIFTIADRLLKSGNALVFDGDGNKARKIKLREEYLLFGSYHKAFVFLDGEEIIVTSVRFGE